LFVIVTLFVHVAESGGLQTHGFCSLQALSPDPVAAAALAEQHRVSFSNAKFLGKKGKEFWESSR